MFFGKRLIAMLNTDAAWLSRHGRRAGMALLLLLMLTLGGMMRAQDSAGASVYTYGCVYDEASHTLQIRAVLTDSDSAPLFVDSVSVPNLDLPEGSATIQRVEERQPVRMIAVIDTTRSYPVEAMRDTLQDAMQNFPVLDELALVTFNDRVSPLLGPPTIEKLAVIDEYRDRIVPGGDPQAGIAVLYDGILTALRDGVDPASPLRQVVLVLTDSPHRNERSDTTERDVIERAQAVNAQVYVIAFDTIQDTPDFEVLAEIASATDGHLWTYGQNEGDDKSIGTLTDQMRDILASFQQTLDSEYLITISADTLEPDPSTLTVPLEVVVGSGGQQVALGTFDCVLPLVDHSIAFTNLTNNLFIMLDQQPFVIAPPVIDSPLAEDERETRLFLNDSTAPLLGSTLSLDDPIVQDALLPADNRLRVELYDIRGDEPQLLAVDEVTGINLQRPLSLSVEGDSETVSGETTFVAVVDGGVAVPENRVVRFGVHAGDGEYQRLLPTSPDLIDGEARLTIDDINARTAELFGEDAENLEVIAYIDGSAPDGSDALFVSDPLPITLDASAVDVVSEPEAVEPAPDNTALVIPLVVAGVLVLVDLILLRQIRAARVRRLIKYPDNRELPQNTLRVTLTRDGRHQMYTLTKQTMSVGRGSSNDINLSDDTNISREHGVIMWRGGRWYYANRKPQAKVSIGGKTLRGYRMRELTDNTQMQIGDYTLVCHYDTEADPDSLLRTQF